jgi:hypothetical protein
MPLAQVDVGWLHFLIMCRRQAGPPLIAMNVQPTLSWLLLAPVSVSLCQSKQHICAGTLTIKIMSASAGLPTC